VPIEVELVPPPGVAAAATVTALVFDPGWGFYGRFSLLPGEGNVYAAGEPLQLPLEPEEGEWQLAVDVQSTLGVEGEHRVAFYPSPIVFRDLGEILPAGVALRVPVAFEQVAGQGDRVAGARVFRHGGGEVALWWAPGSAETLRLDSALVMLEATHTDVGAPEVLPGEETEWQGRVAFRFHEQWRGEEGGPARVLVVQDARYWLYVVRVRAIGGDEIPSLSLQVWETFGFVEGDD
jgi:hypothetical protein